MTNQVNGRISPTNLQYVDLPAAELEAFRVQRGDILFNRTNSFELVGRTAIFDLDGEYVFASYLIKLRTHSDALDPYFLNCYLNAAETQRRLKSIATRAVSQSNISASRLREFVVPVPPLAEQKQIAWIVDQTRRAIEDQDQIVKSTSELRKALLHKLFTQGLRGEPQKQTEFGPMPESWVPTSIGDCCDIVSGSMSYTEFLGIGSSDSVEAVDCMGVKVSDMNLIGNESKFVAANASRRIPASVASRKLIPPNTVVLPKRGAAIATNKKRLTTTWTVLDPNLIGIRAKDSLLETDFLFHWIHTFDLRKITNPGPTPQLNKKDLIPVRIPLPPDRQEQRDIANIISAVDRKLTLHKSRCATMIDLHSSLVFQLMSARLRVSDLDLPSMNFTEE